MTLLILAAGMGSRFGGLKQMEPMGPNGEFIIDFGFPTNPSSSALIDKWKYKACADVGISRNASLSIIVLLNILRSAITTP